MHPQVIRPGVALLSELLNNYMRDGAMPLPPRRPYVSSLVDADMKGSGTGYAGGPLGGGELFHNKIDGP